MISLTKRWKYLLLFVVVAGFFSLLVFYAPHAQAAGTFKPDTTVTAVGKMAARAREVLNWSLSIQDAGFSSTSKSIADAWAKIRNISTIVALIILFVIAFGMILHTSWADGQRRNLVALFIAIALSYLSFTIFVSVIKGVDTFQNKLFNVTSAGVSRHLKAEDLLTVTFSYQDFKGYRDTDPNLEEAASNTLFLVKATAWTNYAIAAVIVLRVVILWLLVVFSPLIFPLLAFVATRKVALLWFKQFGLWLFLGPIFAIFITAVPYIWQNTNIKPNFLPSGATLPGSTTASSFNRQSGIPLQTDNAISEKPKNVYQSGTNIILVPPGEANAKLQTGDVAGSGNNLSETDTYVRYIVALVMIWIAILLPFAILWASLIIITNTTNAASVYQLSNYLKAVGGKLGRAPQSTAKQAETNLSTKLDRPQVNKPVYVSPENAGINSRSKSETIEKTMSVQSLATATGLTLPSQEISEIIKTQEVTGKSAPLVQLAKIETEISSHPEKQKEFQDSIERFRNAGATPSSPNGQKMEAVKNAIFIKQMEGSRAARSLSDTLSLNTSGLENQDLKASLVVSNLDSLSKAFNNNGTVENEVKKEIETKPELNQTKPIWNQYENIKQIVKESPEKIIKNPTNLKAVIDFSGKLSAAQQLNTFAQSGKDKIDTNGQPLRASEGLTNHFSGADEQSQWQKFAQTIQKAQESNPQGPKIIDSANKLAKVTNPETNEPINQVVTKEMKDSFSDEKSLKDFDEVKAIWEKQYLTGEIPESAHTQDRISWLKSEISHFEDVLSDLTNEKTRAQGLKKLEKALPFVLLGGYELSDVVVYVKAKIVAAANALKKLVSKDQNDQKPQGGQNAAH